MTDLINLPPELLLKIINLIADSREENIYALRQTCSKINEIITGDSQLKVYAPILHYRLNLLPNLNISKIKADKRKNEDLEFNESLNLLLSMKQRLLNYEQIKPNVEILNFIQQIQNMPPGQYGKLINYFKKNKLKNLPLLLSLLSCIVLAIAISQILSSRQSLNYLDVELNDLKNKYPNCISTSSLSCDAGNKIATCINTPCDQFTNLVNEYKSQHFRNIIWLGILCFPAIVFLITTSCLTKTVPRLAKDIKQLKTIKNYLDCTIDELTSNHTNEYKKLKEVYQDFFHNKKIENVTALISALQDLAYERPDKTSELYEEYQDLIKSIEKILHQQTEKVSRETNLTRLKVYNNLNSFFRKTRTFEMSCGNSDPKNSDAAPLINSI